MAIRDQLIRPQMLPELISKAPMLYNELSAGINTNLTLEQAIKLAWLAQQIPEENIKQGVIAPPDMVLLSKSTEGDEVLKPITEKIRLLRDEVFFGTETSQPGRTAACRRSQLVQAEAPRLTVLNGTSETGLAARTTEYLKSQGMQVANTGNADQLYTSTTVIDYTGKPYTLDYLVDMMKIAPNNIFIRYDPASPVDVVLILGQDWATSNPMP